MSSVTNDSSDKLKQFTFDSLCERTPPVDFIERLSVLIQREKFDVDRLSEICEIILHSGNKVSSNSSLLAFDYLELLHMSKIIDDVTYIECLNKFNIFERVTCVTALIQKLNNVVNSLSCSYMDQAECVELCRKVFSVLLTLVGYLCGAVAVTSKAVDECAVLVTMKSTDATDEAMNESVAIDEPIICANIAILQAILALQEDDFSRVFIYLHITSGESVSKEFLEITGHVQNCCEFLTRKFDHNSSNFMTKCIENAENVLKNFTKFKEPPELKWEYFRDDFICREFRPAILTLGSIFATFRVLKSNEQIAEAFLVVGDSLGMSRPQIIFDILRAGFLIQLETAANARPEQSHREPMADTFVFLRIPIIFARLIDLGVSQADIFDALHRLSKCSTLLNELDTKLFDNSFNFVIEKLNALCVITQEQFNRLSANRKLGMEQNLALMELLHHDGGDSRQKSRIQIMVVAQKAKKVFDMNRQEIWTEMKKKIETLMLNVSYIDLICAVCCADEDLSAFSAKLATINQQTQNPSSSNAATNRIYMFDSTFILLSRIAIVWEDLRLEDLVGEHLNGAFYNWMKRYTHCLDVNEPMPVDSHLKLNFLHQFNILKTSTPFWNDTWDFASLIDHVPLVGDIILDEYKNERCNEKEIHNILTTFRQMPCLLLCLVQWLETQPMSSARQAFSKTLRSFGNTRGQETSDKWLYAMLVERKCSRKTGEGRRQREQPYTWVINFAQRQLPNIAQYQNETPDLQMLKETFLYSNQQGWASPDVVALINRCNRDVKHREWCTCWMKQMLKAWTSDEMDIASELCLSTAITSPVPCFLEIVHTLVDFVLFNASSTPVPITRGTISLDASSSSSTTSSSSSFHYPSNYVNVEFHKASANELAKMLVRTLVLLIWAEDGRKADRRRRALRKLAKKRKMEEDSSVTEQAQSKSPNLGEDSILNEKQIKIEAMDVDDSEKSSIAIPTAGNKDTVLETIIKMFGRFDNMIKGACLKPAVTFVIFFIHEIAKAPKTPYRQRLIDLIPIKMLFALARFDVAALPLSMFLQLYDISDERNRMHCLKYACMMRKFQHL